MKIHTLLALLVALCAVLPAVPEDDLAQRFKLPPDNTRPWVYWFTYDE